VADKNSQWLAVRRDTGVAAEATFHTPALSPFVRARSFSGFGNAEALRKWIKDVFASLPRTIRARLQCFRLSPLTTPEKTVAMSAARFRSRIYPGRSGLFLKVYSCGFTGEQQPFGSVCKPDAHFAIWQDLGDLANAPLGPRPVRNDRSSCQHRAFSAASLG
jgi:hypothetical protein